MKNKAPLTLMEQTVMLLIFALAAALCLRAFVWADGRSSYNAKRDEAVNRAECAGEVLKSCRGDLEEAAELYGGTAKDTLWQVEYDDGCVLRAELMEGEVYLGGGEVTVTDDSGQTLVMLTVRWQEVDGDG